MNHRLFLAQHNFQENLNKLGEKSHEIDPQNYNLYSGLINLTAGLGEVEQKVEQLINLLGNRR